jgi:thiamine biosynthesis lipoprotein
VRFRINSTPLRLKPSPAPPPRAVEEISGETFHGFGTTVGAWATDPGLVTRLDHFMRAWVETVEAACSRFREDSDISRANAAAGRPVRVSPTLLQAADAAVAMAELTGGLCDPTVGEAVINAGYDRTFEAIVAEGPGPEGPARGGGAWRQVEVDHQAGTITIPAGYRLDLGGSAKGWAVDSALATLERSILAENPGAGICITAGGDLGVAGRAPETGWPVTVRERLDGEDHGTEVFLARGAVATSGATARRWRRGEVTGHHIIDPRSGRPGSSHWSLVTVFSDSCLLSDVAATTAWLLDGEAEAWLGDHRLGARLVDDGGAITVVGDLGAWLTGAILA